MTDIPRAEELDSSLALLREGYDFIGNRCRRLESDIFAARLLGRRVYFVRGADSARMFYEPGRFTRRGAMPRGTLKLLQDEGSVATLDDAEHRHRKAMFLSLMVPDRLEAMAERAAAGLHAAARDWAGRGTVRLHDEFRRILCAAACDWSGLPAEERQIERLTAETGAMIDYAGSIGPLNWLARLRRRPAEGWLRQQVQAVRAGEAAAPVDSALAVIAGHRDLDGQPLDGQTAAVELLNIVRPVVAIARFMTFAALALHEHPEHRARVAKDPRDATAFAHEVRRLCPFFPFVAGVARTAFDWRGIHFAAGDRVVLDLYGTNRDGRSWVSPDRFDPGRFRGWTGDAYALVPQGGGAHEVNHRCPGEWMTVAVMRALLQVLAGGIGFELPPQDLAVDLTRMPALPRSGVVVTVRGPATA